MINNIVELIKIKSETGNIKAMRECISYCKNMFKGQNVFIKEVEQNGQPSVLISNANTMNFDVLQVGHIDVVQAKQELFSPTINDGKLYGRGAIDMKSFVITALGTLQNVIANNIHVKYGVLIVSDEETGGLNGAKYWTEELQLTSKIVLDPDGGKNINTIIQKAKGVLIIDLVSKGIEAHGSRPWLGIDANENLFRTISNLRKEFPYYSTENIPSNTWTTTMHVGTIQGGKAMNQISDFAKAQLDFRLTEEMNSKKILECVEQSLVTGVKYKIGIEGLPVLNEEDDANLKLYTDCIKQLTNKSVILEHADGGSDGRYFSKKGTTVITHQGTGDGAHSNNEWVDIDSLCQLERIQTEFIKKLSENM